MMFQKPLLQSISGDFISKNDIKIDVLRLDLVHPIISGNKWYKLKYFLQKASANNAPAIATFGGAYSNHIAATAFAAKAFGFKSFGIIRGEAPKSFSHTLENAEACGMKLHFVPRDEYRQNKDGIKKDFSGFFWIDEGGYGIDGAAGASEILGDVSLENYTHIICAIGTGTTFAGMVKKSLAHQKIIGISVMKNNFDIINQINALLTIDEQQKNFEVNHNFHFGGYAKKNDELINFMNEIYSSINLPLDFVYTAKAFYGLSKLIEQKTISSQSKVLFIHTGGLQGNLSLPEGVLKF